MQAADFIRHAQPDIAVGGDIKRIARGVVGTVPGDAFLGELRVNRPPAPRGLVGQNALIVSRSHALELRRGQRRQRIREAEVTVISVVIYAEMILAGLVGNHTGTAVVRAFPRLLGFLAQVVGIAVVPGQRDGGENLVVVDVQGQRLQDFVVHEHNERISAFGQVQPVQHALVIAQDLGASIRSIERHGKALRRQAFRVLIEFSGVRFINREISRRKHVQKSSGSRQGRNLIVYIESTGVFRRIRIGPGAVVNRISDIGVIIRIITLRKRRVKF